MPQPRLDEDLLNRPGSRREIATPALVLDLDALEANVAAMAGWAQRTGIALRPHAKTHKCAAIGRLQLQAGALGLCCAKLAEAEALAAAGLDRFLLTSPVTGKRKLERLLRLAARCAELMVVVDDADNARTLAAAAEAAGRDLGVLIDVDIGQQRTGVTDPAQALALAEIVAGAPRLSLKGVQGYAGQVQHIADFAERKRQSHASLALLATVRDRLEAAGYPCPIVTGGGTGSHARDPSAGVLTELQEKVAENDPYIATLRIAVNRPGVTRVVLDLKSEVRPQVFALKPIAEYGHRLVLDLYPLVPPDPLVALLELNGQLGAAPGKADAGKPSVLRLATVVVDAGHGGEDPGARGRRGTREKDITLSIAKRLYALIDAQTGMRAVLTGDGD